MGNICDNCGASFDDAYEFTNHTRTCIVNTQQEHIPDECNPVVHSNPIPNAHSNFNPSSFNNRRCTLCYQFKSISKFHKGKYRCKDCLKAKVICPQCNISISKDCLLRHTKEVHEEKVTLKCLKCDKLYNKRYFINHKCIPKTYEIVP